MTKAQISPRKRIVMILSALWFAVLAAFYGFWILSSDTQTVAAGIVSAFVCALIGLIGANTIKNVFSSWAGEPEFYIDSTLGKRSLRAGFRHPYEKLFLALLLSRLLVFVVMYALHVLYNGYDGALLDNLYIWMKGDAPHYLGIADNWYVTEGDARFHIVFFPLYPMLVNLFKGLAGSTFSSGLLVSLMCAVVSGVLLYELALYDLDRAAAKRAVKFQMLLPAAFLLNAPMSDSLFLVLSIACLLYARKKKYTLACLMGGLASLTRVLGILLIVPIFVELAGDIMRTRSARKNLFLFALPRVASLFLIPLGFIIYLMINQRVTGDAFTFMHYQSTHWHQRLGLFFSTACNQTNYFLKTIKIDRNSALGLWLPNVLYLIIAPIIMLLGQRELVKPGFDEYSEKYRFKQPATQPYRIRASYEAYFLAYYVVSIGATWLLSAPRYLTCCFPLSIALASISKNRVVITLLYCALFVAQILYMTAYVRSWPVY